MDDLESIPLSEYSPSQYIHNPFFLLLHHWFKRYIDAKWGVDQEADFAKALRKHGEGLLPANPVLLE